MPITYLKKELQTNVPATVLLKKRLPSKPELDFTTKEPTGRQDFPYLFIMDGRELWHYAKETEQAVLENYKEGEEVQVCRVEKEKADGKRIYFLQWGSVGSAEMKAAPQLKTNTAVVREERQKDDYEKEKMRKDLQIGLQGYHQVFIGKGEDTHTALLHAVEARRMLDQQVDLLLNPPV